MTRPAQTAENGSALSRNSGTIRLVDQPDAASALAAVRDRHAYAAIVAASPVVLGQGTE
jgi:hypothetical protein